MVRPTPLVLLLAACVIPRDSQDTGVPDDDTAVADTSDTSDTSDTGDSKDTVDSADTSDTSVADTADTSDTGTVDTGDTGATPPVPDFMLADVNATSATYGQQVSPRHYLNEVSAWYFLHST